MYMYMYVHGPYFAVGLYSIMTDIRNLLYFTREGQYSRPMVYRERTKRQMLRNSPENNALGVCIRLVRI